MFSKISSLISKIQNNWTDFSQTNLLKPSPNPEPIFTSESCKCNFQYNFITTYYKQKKNCRGCRGCRGCRCCRGCRGFRGFRGWKCFPTYNPVSK